MKFILSKSGDFETLDGVCLGNYLEFFFDEAPEQTKEGLCFKIKIVHSLIHNDDCQEYVQWLVTSISLFKFLFDNLKPDKLNKISVEPKKFFCFKYVSIRINHSKLPYHYNF